MGGSSQGWFFEYVLVSFFFYKFFLKAIKFFPLCSWRVLNRESSSLLSFFCVGRGKETWWFFVFLLGSKRVRWR